MITVKNNCFHLATENTSYVFFINERGIAEHLYYGRRLRAPEMDTDALRMKRIVPRKGEVSLSQRSWEVTLNDTPLEFSCESNGDFRTPFISMRSGRNCVNALDLRFRRSETFEGVRRADSPLVQATASGQEAHGIRVDFSDDNASVLLSLYYTVFPASDTIVRRAVVRNNSRGNITLEHIASCQLDFFTSDWTVSFTGGPWGRENRTVTPSSGFCIMVNESRNGFTGQKSSTVYIENKDCCIISGLLYSGDHRQTAEVTHYGKLHFVTGINPDTIKPVLKPNETFETPEAFLVMGPDRKKAVSMLHGFEENFVMRGTWKNRLRPIAYSTRYSLGMAVREERVIEEVKIAGQLGFELFILDDGWFSVRNEETSSIGDWSADTLKIPSGLAAISRECHKAGLLFGLWIAPECVSVQSRLALEHPDWLVRNPARKLNPVEGGQYLLDITQDEVFDYVSDTLRHLIERTGLDCLVWNIGTQAADIWSKCDEKEEEGTWRHRYILAFNRLQRSVAVSFPNLLIHNTSSTCPRFDASQLASAALLSATAVTDSFELLEAYTGAARIIPPGCLAGFITDRRFNSEGRYTSFSSAFNIGMFTCLCYSIKLKGLSHKVLQAIAEEVAFYKMHRHATQYGDISIEETGSSLIISAASRDKKEILILLAKREVSANGSDDILIAPDADPDAVYQVMRRTEDEEICIPEDEYTMPPLEREAYIISGDTLKHAGLRLCEQYLGSSYTEDMRVMGDHSTRLYLARRIDQGGNQ